MASSTGYHFPANSIHQNPLQLSSFFFLAFFPPSPVTNFKSTTTGTVPFNFLDQNLQPNMASSIGSSSWIGADAYEPGGEWHARAMAFLDEIKWHVLVSIASRLRGDTPCHLDAKFSIGHFNMVRRIVFSDGVSWVARLRLPPLTAESGGGDSLDVARRTLKVEVAGMRFLKYVVFEYMMQLKPH